MSNEPTVHRPLPNKTPRTSRSSVNRYLNVHELEEQGKNGAGANLPIKNSSYVHVNRGYEGELSSYSKVPMPNSVVVREQYWACSRWPRAQRILALTVGVLVGALIGLAVTLSVKLPPGNPIIDNIIQRTPSGP